MRTLPYLFILIMTSLASAAMGQVSVSLNVDANPNPKIADWMDRSELAIVTVTNSSPELEGTPFKVKVRVLRDGDLVAEVNPAKMPSRSLPLGSDVFLADELIPYNAVSIYGKASQTVAKTGMLPAGVYSFCVTLVDQNNDPLTKTGEVCRPMFITDYQAPELIYPHSKAQVPSQMLPGTEFVWTPVTPNPPAEMGVKYVVVISEVYENQTPSQAFFNNYPLVEEEIEATNRMLWPVDLDTPEEPTQYVWNVKAVTLDGDAYVEQNSGFSSLGTFVVDPENPMAKMGGDGDGEEEGEIPPVTPGTVTVGDTLYAGLNGEFEVLVTSAQANNNKYTGQGTVFVQWLNARVEVGFDTILVDTQKHLAEGEIIALIHENAPVYPVDWALEAVANVSFTNQLANNIVDWVENTSGQTIPFDNVTEYTTPVKMPLGVVFPDGNELAINEMAFLPVKSEFNMIAAKAVPPSWGTTRLGFRAKNIRFHPANIEMPPGRIELVEDITMGNVNNDMVFVFKKPDTNHLGCYIEWDEDGFSEYGVELETLFTRDWLLPSPDNDPAQKVAASLTATGNEWGDLIMGGTLEKAEIVGTGGVTILADSLYYDFSDVSNAPAMTFPENYPGDDTETFRGFYMQSLELEMPDAWQTQANNKPKIAVHDMIIDNVGITLLAEATSVVQFPDANVADLVASIDTVHVELIASSLVEGGIKGRVGLPVSKKDSIQNPLEYVALFNNPQLPNEPVSFQLTVTPTGPIAAHMLKGDFELAQTSNIVAYVGQDKKTFDINLDGDLKWNNIKLGPINNVNFGLAFQGVGMNYDSTNDDDLGFSIGSWAFASEQKILANFPITIEEVDYTMLASQPGQMLHGKVGFDVIFNLSSDIGGMSRLGVEFAVQDNTSGQKFYPEYIATSIDSISVHANLSAVNIKGAIGFRNEDPVYGNGFIGSLDAEFKAVGISVSALAEFGNTSYQNANQLYRYWRVEADVMLPAPGVVFMPGVAFRGFGGGAFYNMEVEQSGTSFTFTPLKSSLGFRAKATLATTPKEDGFNADVGLLGQFSTSSGLTYIAFTGDFWIGADLTSSSRAKAKIDGNLSASYNFPDRHFNFSTNVNVNAPPITTPSPVNMVLDIDGKNNQWYFKFGEPQNLNTVRVLGVNLYEYLMFGNHIPTPNGFTPTFRNAYHGAVGHYPGGNIGSGGVGGPTQTGSGFALGIGFMFDKSDQKHLTGNYYLAYQLGAGAEMHLAFLNYNGSCDGHNPIGINGWRANGGLGFYGTAGAQVKRIGGLLKDKTWNIASLAAGAWIYGEFPNPYYATGAVSGHAYVFKIVNVSFHKQFEVGAQCGNSAAGGGAPVVQGDVAADQQEKLIQYVKPSQTYNYPEESPLVVKYGLIPDEVFDVSEQQSDGTILNRTFKLEVERKLEIKDENGNWSTVGLNTSENNLGEHLYTTIGSALGGPNQFATDFGSNSNGGLTGNNSVSNDASTIIGSGTFAGGTNAMVFQQIAVSPSGTSGNNNTGQSGSGGGSFAGDPGFSVGPMLSLPYPVDPPEPSYGDLPPTPEPPENSLKEDRDYRFTVTATLKEYKNGSWANALKNNGSTVTETVEKTFRTGPIQPLNPSFQQFSM